MEIWKSLNGVVECGDYYEVSNLGRVRSVDRYIKGKNNTKRLRKGKMLKQNKDKDGYLKVVLFFKKSCKSYFVHRLVALSFIDNPNNEPIINHKDENPSNNHKDNLEWCSHKYNINYGNRNKKVSNKFKNSTTRKEHITKITTKRKKKIILIKHNHDNTFSYISTFCSLSSLCKEMNFSISTISKVTKNNREYKGYYFKYVE